MLKLSNNILSKYSTSKKKKPKTDAEACNRILDLTHKIYNFIKCMQVYSVLSRLWLIPNEEWGNSHQELIDSEVQFKKNSVGLEGCKLFYWPKIRWNLSV